MVFENILSENRKKDKVWTPFFKSVSGSLKHFREVMLLYGRASMVFFWGGMVGMLLNCPPESFGCFPPLT